MFMGDEALFREDRVECGGAAMLRRAKAQRGALAKRAPHRQSGRQ
jgi:hypothetical protein